MKQLFAIKTRSVRNGCSFSNEHFPIVSAIRIVNWLQKCSQNPFFICWFLLGYFRYVRWSKNLILVEPLVVATHTWSSSFIISKHLDSMQYYMRVKRYCGHRVVKGLATVGHLDKEQFDVCLVTWRDYSFAFTENSFCPPFSNLSTIEAVCLAFY